MEINIEELKHRSQFLSDIIFSDLKVRRSRPIGISRTSKYEQYPDPDLQIENWEPTEYKLPTEGSLTAITSFVERELIKILLKDRPTVYDAEGKSISQDILAEAKAQLPEGGEGDLARGEFFAAQLILYAPWQLEFECKQAAGGRIEVKTALLPLNQEDNLATLLLVEPGENIKGFFEQVDEDTIKLDAAFERPAEAVAIINVAMKESEME